MVSKTVTHVTAILQLPVCLLEESLATIGRRAAKGPIFVHIVDFCSCQTSAMTNCPTTPPVTAKLGLDDPGHSIPEPPLMS